MVAFALLGIQKAYRTDTLSLPAKLPSVTSFTQKGLICSANAEAKLFSDVNIQLIEFTFYHMSEGQWLRNVA